MARFKFPCHINKITDTVTNRQAEHRITPPSPHEFHLGGITKIRTQKRGTYVASMLNCLRSTFLCSSNNIYSNKRCKAKSKWSSLIKLMYRYRNKHNIKQKKTVTLGLHYDDKNATCISFKLLYYCKLPPAVIMANFKKENLKKNIGKRQT